MYLKQLEIQGFKSFPNKNVFVFDKGITSIVGPNGSGKSNISDAIRWVLGEQSAKNLRGEKMEDIIFAGTITRKSIGFAEVSLILDNSDKIFPLDFSEVKVTRKVFRSGESNYSINGATCRLKDVQELFMDTGIGKEGYSIIGQGRIDEILKSKSEDRRYLFEEATGIVKYKNRKKEAENKLKKEKENLVRIDDILMELEKQIVPLEKQSNDAKKYLSLYEELKTLKINLFLRKVDILNNDIKKEKENFENLTSEVKEKEKEINNHSLLIEKKKKELEVLEEEITNINIENNKYGITENEKKNQKNIINEQINNTKINIENLKNEKINATKKIDVLKNDIVVEKNKIQVLNKTLENIKDEKLEKEAYYKKINANMAEIDELNALILKAIENENIVKNKIDYQESHYENLSNNKENLLLDIERLNTSLIESKAESAVLNKRINEKKEEYNKLEEKLSYYNDKYNRLDSELKELINTDTIKNNRFSELNGKYNILSNLAQFHEGFYDSVKYVLKNNYDGVVGAVGELIKVPSEYEKAISIALGGRMQNIITKDEFIAKKIINELKSNNKGRCTFLPISRITKSKFNYDLKNEEGYLGLASELIDFDKSIDNIIGNLIGRIVIVDNIDNALKLSKKYKNSFRIVTLSGEDIAVSGAITGGSIRKQNSSVFSRSRELEELTKEIAVLKKEIKDNSHILKAKNKEFDTININIEKIKDIKETLNFDINEISNKLLVLESEISFNSTNAESKKIENEALNKNILEEHNKLNDLYNDLENYKSDKKELEDKVSEYNSNILSKKEQEEQINILMEFASQISKTEENIKNTNNNIIRINNEIKSTENQQNIIDEKINSSNASISDKKIYIDKLDNEIEGIGEELKNLSIKLNESIMKEKVLRVDIDDIQNMNKEIESRINALENKKVKSEILLENKEKEYRVSYDEMWNEYEITYNTAKDFYNEELELDFINENIDKNKKLIRDLGHVNVASIEQYAEVKERYDFMQEQYDDIIKSEKQLVQIINELTKHMGEQFKENFEIIRKNFKEVFVEIFQGGDADLQLLDSDVLNSGINIVAKPPGKKLTNLNLLSGGERALTAIALLFGILKMKPSPFCVLDEIEAALDDANVDRYAKFLRKFAEDTQFILITHRKGTMEIADILYGISMEEKGVSSQVSLKLV